MRQDFAAAGAARARMGTRNSRRGRTAPRRSACETFSRPSGTNSLFLLFPSAEGAGLLSCCPSGALMFIAPSMGSELDGDGLAVGIGGLEELAGLGAGHIGEDVCGERLDLCVEVADHGVVVAA